MLLHAVGSRSSLRPRATIRVLDAGERRRRPLTSLQLIFAGRALRSFAFGWLSVFLALFLAGKGLGAGEIGLVFTATMVEDAILTLFLSTMAARWGPARVMAATAPLIALGGLLLATAESRWLLLAGAVLGTLSPNGQEAGPFAPMEQSLLPGAAGNRPTVRVFGWYNVVSFLPAAAGAAVAGLVLGAATRHGFGELEAQRGMLLAYAAAGAVLTLLYAGLARIEPGRAPAVGALGSLGLGHTRGPVLRLARLQMLDAFAGGFIMQSLLAYWFHLRFGAGPEALGALFFGTNLLSALSFLVAARVGEKHRPPEHDGIHAPAVQRAPDGRPLHADVRRGGGGAPRPARALADGRAHAAGVHGGPGGSRGEARGGGARGERPRPRPGVRPLRLRPDDGARRRPPRPSCSRADSRSSTTCGSTSPSGRCRSAAAPDPGRGRGGSSPRAGRGGRASPGCPPATPRASRARSGPGRTGRAP